MSTSPEPEEEPREVFEEIAPRGDVIFNVGDRSPRHRLLVSSAILTMASTAFAGFLNPRFAEGSRSRSQESPAEIQLPDDDPQAMSDLCHLLHLRPVPDLVRIMNFDVDRVLALAIVTDKYCCSEVLRLQLRAILQSTLNHRWVTSSLLVPYHDIAKAPARYLTKIASAAFLLDQGKIFHDATRAMVGHHTGPFSALRGIAGLPIEVLLALQEIREHLRLKIATDLAQLGTRRCDYCDGYAQDKEYIQHICNLFDTISWPPNFEDAQLSVIKSFSHIRTLDTWTSATEDLSECCQAPDYNPALSRYRDQFESLADRIERECRGLCLRCVREDLNGLTKVCFKPEHRLHN